MTRLQRIALLWAVLCSVAFGYTGDTVPSQVGGGYSAAVRDDSGRIVWGSKLKFATKEAAQKKADKKAEKMNKEEGVVDNCAGPAGTRPEWCP